jgi:ABC-type nitrate/sulfonate/bicarbonate transport system substrate-binding protein
MRTLRCLLVPAAIVLLTLPLAVSAYAQQTKVTIGKVIGGDGFHVPTYVALDQGFFKAEGLDGSLLELDPRSQVTGVISGNLDCAPIPSGGAQAALSGAKIMYIVGESLKSQWTITSRQDINKPEDLKGKVLGYGRQGGADYDEAQAVLHRFFHMDVGKDYKVISFQGEPERIAAMSNNDIQGASLSIPHAAVAEQAGLKVLLRTGDYIPRAGGTIWCSADFVQKNPETVKKIIRAIAKAVMYFRTNKEGSIAVLRHHVGSINTDDEAGLIWDQLHNTLGAEGSVPRNLRIAPPHHDRGAAMAGGQAAARSRRLFGPRPARSDAQRDGLRADQYRGAGEGQLSGCGKRGETCLSACSLLSCQPHWRCRSPRPPTRSTSPSAR